MARFNSSQLVEILVDGIANEVGADSFTVDSGPPAGEEASGLVITELRPANPNSSFIRIISTEGSNEIDIELASDARFDWFIGRSQSAEEFAAEIIDFLRPVVCSGFTQRVTYWRDRRVRVRTQIGSTSSTTMNLGVLRVFGLRARDVVYEGWKSD